MLCYDSFLLLLLKLIANNQIQKGYYTDREVYCRLVVYSILEPGMKLDIESYWI